MGKKVLVLEQHYTAGGFTHAYDRNGYEWDVGVHYIGDMGAKTAGRGLFDFISNGQLQWAEMDPVYDRIILGEESFDFVAGKENFKNELKKHFPEEASAIDAYVELISKTNKYMGQITQQKALPKGLLAVKGLLGKNKVPDYVFQDTYSVLKGLTDNEKLIAVLCGQWGDHGLPPKKSTFVMHAIIARHYLHGGFYPIGGASKIAETIIPQIQTSGGDVFTYADVTEIIIDNGRATGVTMKDGHKIFAPTIISNAGAINTFTKLLPSSISQSLGYQQKAESVERSMSHLGMYIGLKGTPEELDLPKTNLWIYPSADHDGNVAAAEADPKSPFPVVYVSFPSAKDPDFQRRYPGRSTIEIVTGPCDFEEYRQWADKTWGKRGDDYEAFKEELSQRMLAALFKQMPHLEGKIDYYETSTPLSTDYFCRYEHGEAYGLAHTRHRFEQEWLTPQTKIPGLYLTGQDIVSCGVVGALMAGMVTAMKILGLRGSGKLLKMIKAA
ncbi:phytoene desaturase family protein [Oceanicoccus sagamiensis]|uniref:phytoene desaturase family protein n=1 Tax=Oceanicoccus sagamiensis TaxID=716816 RepID=UPI001F0AEDB0|nr:NAD(P)/FAD-dependent oxidoreductase [Oceanicoccus sagamiensis]